MVEVFKNKKFLVCGGCGFMGSNFIRYLLSKSDKASVVNLDLLTYAGNVKNLEGLPVSRYRLVRGDIADINLAKKLMREADFVINFAAETHVDRSIHGEAGSFIHSNILGVHALLEALRSLPNVTKMVHISTDEVWGDLPLGSRKRFDENAPFKPSSPYAASKAAGDLLVRAYVRTYGLPVIVTHSVNNFGPRQFPEKLIPFFTLRALKGDRLPLYGDGKNVRDWLYVDDHSEAILTILEKGKTGEVYAISGGEEYSNLDLVRLLLKMLDKPESLITFVKDRPGHDRRYSVDSSKLRGLGWEPRGSINRQLSETVGWYKANPGWVKSVLTRNSGLNTHL